LIRVILIAIYRLRLLIKGTLSHLLKFKTVF